MPEFCEIMHVNFVDFYSDCRVLRMWMLDLIFVKVDNASPLVETEETQVHSTRLLWSIRGDTRTQ